MKKPGIFAFVLTCVVLLPLARLCSALAQNSQPNASAAQPNPPSSATSSLPRGKKLVLKDGSFQMVREYQVQGDRVRYYSIDTLDWEEIPADLVDWEATKKAEADENQRNASLVGREKKREDELGAQVLDIDASIEAAPGVFVPPGLGPFAFDGKAIFQLKQADMTSKLSKKKSIEQVFVPVPVVPTRHEILLNGSHAGLKVKSDQPEFYMRTTDGHDPSIDLVRAKVHGDERQIERVDQLLGQERATGDIVPLQRWVIAQGVYRFTLGQRLEPGEYALVEIIQKPDMSFYIWDFSVQASGSVRSSYP